MKACSAILLVGLLVACTQINDSAYHKSNQQRVVPYGLSVTITNSSNEAEGRSFAESYCAKLGRLARFNKIERFRSYRQSPADSALFDCVPEAR